MESPSIKPIRKKGSKGCSLISGMIFLSIELEYNFDISTPYKLKKLFESVRPSIVCFVHCKSKFYYIYLTFLLIMSFLVQFVEDFNKN